jgi:hypothetical protein
MTASSSNPDMLRLDRHSDGSSGNHGGTRTRSSVNKMAQLYYEQARSILCFGGHTGISNVSFIHTNKIL